jgi:hypothetical protein
MRFAITYTVKNEAQLLPAALEYHARLGCAKFFVFFDGTTDESRELVAGRPDVIVQDSINPAVLAETPEWIARLLPRWSESMDVRKRINTFTAARLAQQSGIEWLINIDPDELLLFDDPDRDRGGDPAEFFAAIPPEVDQILVSNLEAVPVGEGTGRPFNDCTLFLRRFPLTEWLWRVSAGAVRRVIPGPKRHAWYDYWFYRLRFRGALPRLMRHPATGEAIPCGYFLGYSNHKAFIRTASAQDFLFNIHRWQPARRAPRTVKRGWLLHYDLPNAGYFCAKFRQRGPAMLVKAFFCRHMFASIARELPFATVQRFFLENICVRDRATIARLQHRGVLVPIGFIAAQMATNDAARRRVAETAKRA